MKLDIDIVICGMYCTVELVSQAAEPDVGINEGWEVEAVRDINGNLTDIELTDRDYARVIEKAGFPSENWEEQ